MKCHCSAALCKNVNTIILRTMKLLSSCSFPTLLLPDRRLIKPTPDCKSLPQKCCISLNREIDLTLTTILGFKNYHISHVCHILNNQTTFRILTVFHPPGKQCFHLLRLRLINSQRLCLLSVGGIKMKGSQVPRLYRRWIVHLSAMRAWH